MAIEAPRKNTYNLVPPGEVRLAKVSAYHGAGDDIQVLLASLGLHSPDTTLPVVVAAKKEGVEGVPQLRIITPEHARSYEEGPFFSKGALARAILGRLFTSESLKGGNLVDPHLEYAGNLPEYTLYWGLIEGDLADTMVRSGKFFFENDIDAELVTEAYKLETVPVIVDGIEKEMSMLEFKDFLYTTAELYNERQLNQGGRVLDLIAVRKRLDEIDFVVIRRLLPMGERIGDFMHLETQEEFDEFLTNVVKGINLQEEARANRDAAYTATKLERSDPEIVEKYFALLAKRAGRNLGRSHARGVLIINGVASNWDASAAIVDLESPIGEAVDNKAAVQELLDKGKTMLDLEAMDIQDLLYGEQKSTSAGVFDVIDYLYEMGFIPPFEPKSKLKELFTRVFLKAYANERYQKIASAPEGKGLIARTIPLLLSSEFSSRQEFFLLDICLFPMIQEEFGMQTNAARAAYAKKAELLDFMETGEAVTNQVWLEDSDVEEYMEHLEEDVDMQQEVRETMIREDYRNFAAEYPPSQLKDIVLAIALNRDFDSPYNTMLDYNEKSNMTVQFFQVMEGKLLAEESDDPEFIEMKNIFLTLRQKFIQYYGNNTQSPWMNSVRNEVYRAVIDIVDGLLEDFFPEMVA